MDYSELTKSFYILLIDKLSEVDYLIGKNTKISNDEKYIINKATYEVLFESLNNSLIRMLLCEMHRTRKSGRLRGEDSAERWKNFIELASTKEFWSDLGKYYPTLNKRITTLVHNRCTAVLSFTEHWLEDKENLNAFFGKDAGSLLELSFGVGDSHSGGKTVGFVRCEGGTVIYKPRQLMVDKALLDFITTLSEVHEDLLTLCVPRVLSFKDHGWAEYITHQYAENDDELRGFYRGIGQWLSVLRLLGGTDMHGQNLIAHGANPVVIDCETMFTPKITAKPSGYGAAIDRAGEWVRGSVLGIGMLPQRGTQLGWRGIDMSASGSLSDQQPMMRVPQIIKEGTDEAYLGTGFIPVQIAQNHPSPEPVLVDYWPEVLSGFESVNHTLRRLDGEGKLSECLEAFADCQIRVVPRATEVYAELARMLWHPVSLHNEDEATARAHKLLSMMAEKIPLASDDPIVVAAEINDLKNGDIPFFTTFIRDSALVGPDNVQYAQHKNLIDAALENWRNADFDIEYKIIQASLSSAYINDGWHPGQQSLWSMQARTENLEIRRRAQAAKLMREIMDNAIRGEDGSVAWIALAYDSIGWSVQPIPQDIYSGLSGLSIVMAAYLHEMQARRADSIEGLDVLLHNTLFTMKLAEAKNEEVRNGDIKVRPLPLGAYMGIGGYIWTWLYQHSLGMDGGDGVARACAYAKLIPDIVNEGDMCDVLYGYAGSIPPLLRLAETTGDTIYVSIACQLGDKLCEKAVWEQDYAYWQQGAHLNGLGGFSHGVTGIG